MDDALQALSALAHVTRLRAFRLLVQAGPAGMPVGALRDQLACPGATLSAHLNVLRHAGLVQDARAGRVIRVRAQFRCMQDLLAFLTANCCAGQSTCAELIPPSCPDTPEATPNP